MKRPFRPFAPKPGHCASVTPVNELMTRMRVRKACIHRGLNRIKTKAAINAAVAQFRSDPSSDHRAVEAGIAVARELARSNGGYRPGDDHPRSA